MMMEADWAEIDPPTMSQHIQQKPPVQVTAARQSEVGNGQQRAGGTRSDPRPSQACGAARGVGQGPASRGQQTIQQPQQQRHPQQHHTEQASSNNGRGASAAAKGRPKQGGKGKGEEKRGGSGGASGMKSPPNGPQVMTEGYDK